MTEIEYKRLEFIVEDLIATNELRKETGKRILEETKKHIVLEEKNIVITEK
jgi:hypothetical protein